MQSALKISVIGYCMLYAVYRYDENCFPHIGLATERVNIEFLFLYLIPVKTKIFNSLG